MNFDRGHRHDLWMVVENRRARHGETLWWTDDVNSTLSEKCRKCNKKKKLGQGPRNKE